MQTLEHFYKFVNKIMESNSRLHKQSVLKEYKDDEIIKKYLQIAFDPYKVYGISTKKLNKEVDLGNFVVMQSVFDLFDYLETHNTGTTEDIIKCQRMLSHVSKQYPECRLLLEKLICKDLSIGVDSKTINKEIPSLIARFDVQLANKYFDKPEFLEGKEFAITTKIDGGRIIAIKEDGKVSLFTRAGQKYEGLVDLETELTQFHLDNFVLDGEITLLDSNGLTSKDQYKQTMKIVRTKDKEKHGVKMLVFDMLPIQDFKKQDSGISYSTRRLSLECMFHNHMFTYFELLPILYKGSDTSKILELLNEQTSKGEEGIMINLLDSYYEFKRTNGLLKVKKFNSADLRIIGFEEGTNKYTNKLGAFICEYKGGEVKVGSGLTDKQREDIWLEKDKYLNTIIEISYFEETKDSIGQPSLRFPTFKDFRPDKTEPNY